jgi:hypothetical protein
MAASALGAARVVAALSLVGAIAAHAWLSPAGGQRWAAILALLAGMLIGWLWHRVTAFAILAVAHAWPLLFFFATGQADANAPMVWMAGLAGLALPGSALDAWRLPSSWQAPVAAWAMILALGWPIVLWRELDFTLVTYAQPDVPNGMFAGPAREVARLATATTVAQLTALLFVDSLWARYRHADERVFVREIVFPLTIGTTIAMIVGLFQGLVDISFWSGGVWPGLGRAAGTFFDANAFGAVSALWGAPAAGAVLLASSRRLRLLGAALLVLSAGAVWVSGSRTALMGWLVVGAGLGRALVRTGGLSRTAVSAGVAAIVVAVAIGAQTGGRGTAVQRFLQTLPRPTIDGLSSFARAMWDRDGYGSAAMRIVGEFPTTGVGPGAFPVLAPDYAYATTGRAIPPDNAQNWWRHMWTELGLLGSIPPMLCSILVAAALVRLARRRPESVTGAIAGSATVALGLMALVGPPMFHPIVLQTIAVLIFWTGWLALRGERSESPHGAAEAASTPVKRGFGADGLALVLVWLLPLVWAGLTLRTAVLELRPPFRAERTGWPYGYGFSPPEPVPGGERRWAAARAVGVIPAAGKRLVLTLEPRHEDLSTRRLRVRVSDRRGIVLDTLRSTREPFECVVEMPPGRRWLMVEIDADRAWATHAGMPWALRVTGRWEQLSSAPPPSN